MPRSSDFSCQRGYRRPGEQALPTRAYRPLTTPLCSIPKECSAKPHLLLQPIKSAAISRGNWPAQAIPPHSERILQTEHMTKSLTMHTKMLHRRMRNVVPGCVQKIEGRSETKRLRFLGKRTDSSNNNAQNEGVKITPDHQERFPESVLGRRQTSHHTNRV